VKRFANLNGALVVLVGIGWGLLAPATKAVLGDPSGAFDGLAVSACRGAWALPAFAVMLALTWPRPFPVIARNRWLALGGAGLLFGCGITVLFSIAAMHTSIAHLSFLIGSSPVTNSAAAALVFRVAIPWRERWALALGIVGVLLLATTRSGGSAQAFGDGLMLIWLLCFAFYAVLLRYGGAGLPSAFVMSIVGTISMAAVVLMLMPFPGVIAAIPHVFDSLGTAGWFFGEIVLGSTLIAQTAYATAVRRVGVAIATIGAEYTALTIGILYSLWVREPWNWVTVVAGVFLVGALAVMLFSERPRRLGESQVRPA
jgi:drug/metabolite transporter (DMT)-like permease